MGLLKQSAFFFLVASIASTASTTVETSTASAQGIDSKRRVATMLFAYDAPKVAAWKALGPEVADVLRRVYDQKDNPTRVRLRALGALSNFPSTSTRAFLNKVAQENSVKPLHNRRAILSLNKAFGEKASTDLLKLLKSDRIMAREAAAECLARMKSPRISAALQKHLLHETDVTVIRAAKQVH